MANETTTTSLTELISAEEIERIIGEENRAASIHELVSWRKEVIPGHAAWAVPRWDKSDIPAGTKAETSEFTNVEATLSEATISPGVVGLSRELTDPAAQDARQNAAEMFALNLRGMRERLTSDVLGLITSATNTSSFSGTNLDLDKWGTATAAFEGQNPYPFTRVAILSVNQLRDLKKAIRNSGGTIEATGRGLGVLGAIQGQIFEFEGWVIVSSGLVPEFDATNDSGALVVVGPGEARVWSTFARAFWWDLRNEVERDGKKQTNSLITSARYGVGITNQSNLREIVSKKAA